MIDSSELPPDFDDGRLVALVGQIYDTVTDPSALTPVLDSLAKVIRGSAAQVYTYDNESGQIVDSSVSSALRDVDNDAYVRYYGAVDPRLRHVYAMPVGTGNRCHSWFDDRFVSGNEFYQDFYPGRLPMGRRFEVRCRERHVRRPGGAARGGDARLRNLDGRRHERGGASLSSCGATARNA